jgi:hypothetical protein
MWQALVSVSALSFGQATTIPVPPPMPMVTPVECQSEACLPGEWLACDTLQVMASPVSTTGSVGSLKRGALFEVTGANSVVRSPGIVRVTRDVVRGPKSAPHRFMTGDTVYVLDHLGEGSFNVWHAGGLVPNVEVFWPGRNWSGFQIAGEVIREPDTEFWLRISTAAHPQGWILEDHEKMLNPLQRTITPKTQSSTPTRAMLRTDCSEK